MNGNQKYFRNHVEIESESSFSTAFSLELEACSAPLWLISAQIEQAPWSESDRLLHTTNIVNSLICELERHINIGTSSQNPPCAFEFSFHLPLHRAISAMTHAIRATYDSEKIKFLFESSRTGLLDLLVRPLVQLQGAATEIGCNMWLRNGMLIRTKALAYGQTNFSSSFIDLDLSLIQAAVSAGLPSSRLMSFIFEQFHVLDSLSILFSDDSGTGKYGFFGESRYNETVLMESALMFISQLARLHTLPSMNIVAAEDRQFYRQQLRREIVTQLCLADRTYSELVDSIPQRHIAAVEMAAGNDESGSTSDDVDHCIGEVAYFKEPSADLTGNVQSGCYVLHDHIWLNGYDFDPTHVMLRANQRKDFQTCMDRYATVVARHSTNAASVCTKQLWPPFSVEGANLNNGSLTKDLVAKNNYLHGVLFSILYLHLRQIEKSVNLVQMSDQLIANAVYLLELAVEESEEIEAPFEHLTIEEVKDLDFEHGFFKSSNIFENICTKVGKIVKPDGNFIDSLKLRRKFEIPQCYNSENDWPGGGFDRDALEEMFKPCWDGSSDREENIDQSLLSIIWQLLQHFKKQQPQKLKCESGKRVFDSVGSLSLLIDKVKRKSERCRQHLEAVENIYKRVRSTSESSDASDDAAHRAAAAAKRRERVMAMMAKQQRAFLEQMVVEGGDTSGTDNDTSQLG